MKRLEAQEQAQKELMEIVKKNEEEKAIKIKDDLICKIKFIIFSETW
jgi:hypothetical protein